IPYSLHSRREASLRSRLSVEVLLEVPQIAQHLFDRLVSLVAFFAQRLCHYPLNLARGIGLISGKRRRLLLQKSLVSQLQLLIDERYQLGERLLVTIAPIEKQLCDLSL